MTDEQEVSDSSSIIRLGDLLRSKKPPSVAELATRIERDGLLGWDRFQRLRRYKVGSPQADFAMDLLAKYADYLACSYEKEDPLWADEGSPDDPYNGYGWTPEELDKAIEALDETAPPNQTTQPKKLEKNVPHDFQKRFVGALERINEILTRIDKKTWNLIEEPVPWTKRLLHEVVKLVDQSLDGYALSTFEQYAEFIVKFAQRGRQKRIDCEEFERVFQLLKEELEKGGKRRQG